MARVSTKENKNIYQTTRESLKLTREAASELLETISPERIEKIESERSMPHPDEVLLMSDQYKHPSLCNYYCANQCPIGQQYVPEVKIKDLSQIVLEMLASLNSMGKQKERLIEITVDGKITGTFTGENYFGGEITALMIEAESLEIGGYDDVYAPAESTKEVGETKEQHGVSVTLDRIEYAKGEARVYLSVKNDSGYQASIYTYDAKAIQDGKQFEHEDNYEAGDSSDIGDVLDGASKEGILRFKGLDPEKPVKIQIGAYSDNFDIEMEDFVFEVE